MPTPQARYNGDVEGLSTAPRSVLAWNNFAPKAIAKALLLRDNWEMGHISIRYWEKKSN